MRLRVLSRPVRARLSLSLLFILVPLAILAADRDSRTANQLEDARQQSLKAISSDAENSAVRAGKVFHGSVDHGTSQALLRYRETSGDGGFGKAYSMDSGSPLFSQQNASCPDGSIEIPGGGCVAGEDAAPEECKELVDKAKTNLLLSLLAFLGAAGLIGVGVLLGWTGIGLGLAMAGAVALMAAGGLAAFQGSKSKEQLKQNAACGLEERKTAGVGGSSSPSANNDKKTAFSIGGIGDFFSGLLGKSKSDSAPAAKIQCTTDRECASVGGFCNNIGQPPYYCIESGRICEKEPLRGKSPWPNGCCPEDIGRVAGCTKCLDGSMPDASGNCAAKKCPTGQVLSTDGKTCLCPDGGKPGADGKCAPKQCPSGQILRADGTCSISIPATNPEFDKLDCKFWVFGCRKLPDLKYKEVDGKPFILGGGDTHDVSPNDIKQGVIGDCYLMASLAEIAQRYPALIKNMVQPNPDGKSHDVTFYQKRKAWELWKPKYTPVTVNVNNQFPTLPNGELAFAQYGDSSDGKKELWSLIVEKAYAQYQKSYNKIDKGGTGADAMQLITGKDSATQRVASTNIEQLADLDAKGYAITVATGKSVAVTRPELDSDHEYYLVGVNEMNKTVILGDPRGGQVTLTEKDFKENFDTVSYNPMK